MSKRLEDTEALSTRAVKVGREAETNSISSTADERKRKGKQGNLPSVISYAAQSVVPRTSPSEETSMMPSSVPTHTGVGCNSDRKTA